MVLKLVKHFGQQDLLEEQHTQLMVILNSIIGMTANQTELVDTKMLCKFFQVARVHGTI